MPQTDVPTARRVAAAIGVCVLPSTRREKKLDVYVEGRRVASIGAIDYGDFLTHGDPQRRKDYKRRHGKYRHREGTPSFYADKILWPSDALLRRAQRLPLPRACERVKK